MLGTTKIVHFLEIISKIQTYLSDKMNPEKVKLWLRPNIFCSHIYLFLRAFRHKAMFGFWISA
jgi:hypothetical protein